MKFLKAHGTDATETTVVHYTSLTAMVSMSEAAANAHGKDPAVVHPKPVFRLYDSVHLNDPDEGRYLLRQLAEHYEWLADLPSRSAYIASFITPNDTGAIDSLSFLACLWRRRGGLFSVIAHSTRLDTSRSLRKHVRLG